MGNSTINFSKIQWEAWTRPEITPDISKQPKHDQLLGFQERKERVAPLSEDEMRARGVPAGRRDYCAHKYLDFEACRKKNWPFMYRCEHQEHDYHHCQREDYIYRVKEFEREKRLLKRDLRRKEKGLDNTDNAEAETN